MCAQAPLGKVIRSVFEGKCRWVKTELLSERKWVAGFEISNISNLDSAELRNLINHIQDLDIERRINASIQATFGGSINIIIN